MNRKVFFILILALIVGLAGGYFYGNKNQKTAISLPCAGDSQDSSANNIIDTEKIALKLNLLKDYTDFVLLPLEKIADPEKYADDMEKKAVEIGDNEIIAKFYATGETADKEQKILDFLDYLNESVKADLR